MQVEKSGTPCEMTGITELFGFELSFSDMSQKQMVQLQIDSHGVLRRSAWIIRNRRPTFPNRRPTFLYRGRGKYSWFHLLG